MIDHADDMSSRESMRTWLYLGAAVLALMLVTLNDRIVEEGPPVDDLQQIDPGSAGSARHAASPSKSVPATPERAVKVDVISLGTVR